MKIFGTNREDLKDFKLSKIECFEVDHFNVHVFKRVWNQHIAYKKFLLIEYFRILIKIAV